MIQGAKYEITRPEDTNLGWKKITIVARRAVGTVTTKGKNGKRQTTEFEYVFIGDSDLIVSSEDDILEDLAMNYSFVGFNFDYYPTLQ